MTSLPADPTDMPLHKDAVQVLTEWSAPDAQQEGLRSDFVDHLQRHPDGIFRDGPPVHLTASCFVLDPTGEQTLLHHHAKGGFWVQVGGHIEPGDPSLAAAALREAREETGLLDLDLDPDLDLRPQPVHLDRHAVSQAFGRCEEHLDVRYLAVVDAGQLPVVSAESHDVAWWPIEALPSTLVPDLCAVLPTIAARLRRGRQSHSGSTRP